MDVTGQGKELENRLENVHDSVSGNLYARIGKTQEDVRTMASSLAEARAASLTIAQVRTLVRDEMAAVFDKLEGLRETVDDLQASMSKQPELGQDGYLAL